MSKHFNVSLIIDEIINYIEEYTDQAYEDSTELAITHNPALQLKKILNPLHPADTAEIIELLSPSQRNLLIDILGNDFDSEILSYLDESVRESVLDTWATAEISSTINEIDEIDAVEILSDLEPAQRRGLLRTLKPEIRVILEESLSYPDESAGRLMEHTFIALPKGWTVGYTNIFLKTTSNFPKDVRHIILVDGERKPIGIVNFTDLIRTTDNSVKLEDISENIVVTVKVDEDQEEICLLFQKYFIDSIPVVDTKQRLVGLIVISNIIDIFYENAQQSFLQSAGVSESDFYETLSTTLVSRLKWITIACLHSLASATILFRFQDIIGANLILNSLLQVLMAICGTAGLQVMTVTVRALLSRNLIAANAKRAILKEVIIGGINGLIYATILSACLFILIYSYTKVFSICIVFASAILLSMTISGLIGSAIPIFLTRLKIDPAVSAGPLMSSLSDSISLILLLSLSSFILGY